MEITVRIILKRPTPDVDFALQKGKGSKYETVQKQRSAPNADLKFEFPVTVKSGKDGAPDFFGPFVQGARGDRYVYIDIGTYAGQTKTDWSRRLKVPLSRITSSLIDSGATLVGEIPGTGKDGGPSCAYAWMKTLDRPWQWKAVG
ncbi:MAG TPA: DUF5990 family protein [Pyrinomonadaceae bacterium]|nr:DUF5990 family protein [Pyrinomonadaceae bacterium]